MNAIRSNAIAALLAIAMFAMGVTKTATAQPLSEDISDYISEIYIEQIWDYGDPTDNNDLMYEFYLEIYSVGDTAINMDADVVSIDFLTPAGNTFRISKLSGQWSNGIWTSYRNEFYVYDPNWWCGKTIWEYKARFTDPADLQAYGDGEYTITLHHSNGQQKQTTALFGIPDTQEPIPQPTQEPVLTNPLHRQTAESPVTFTWEPCTDPNAEYILFEVDALGTARLGDKIGVVDVNEPSWNPVYLADGFWDADLFFGPRFLWSYDNNDGICVSAAKYSRSRYRFTIEGYPWIKYDVWGGNTWIDWIKGRYGDISDLEANGYIKLGESDGQTATFSGQYQYYLIATVGEFLLDSIQGSDGSYYSSFEPDNSIYIYCPDNLLGPPDGRYATVSYLGIDYNGWIAFTNPGNWSGLTVITSDLNLNLSMNVAGTVDESRDIVRNDTITYRICLDSNDFTHDITDVIIVDILPDEVSFVPAENNEVSGTYDPDKHTYTWSYPTLAPESAIQMQLTVHVNPDVVSGTTIANFVTINSFETPPFTAGINVLVSEILTSELSIIPNVLRRNGTSPNITAVVQFPEGIKQSDIDPNDQSVLYYQDRNTEEFILIGKGSRPDLSGSENRPKISISFDRAELMEAVYGYGEFKLRVEGKLKTGLSYYGEGIIHITRFAGD